MSRLATASLRIAFAAGAGLALAGCSDSPVSPVSDAGLSGPSSAVVPVLPPASPGSQSIAIASNSSFAYCGLNGTIFPTSTTVFSGGGGSAFDLTSAIAAYNPGWPAPIAGSSWIGAQANANEYDVLPGSRCFQRDIVLPAGATSPQINLTIKADNLAIVYLNGTEIGRHSPTADNEANFQTNLLITDASAFVAGTNTLRVVLINTRIGYPGDNCAIGLPAGAPQKYEANGGTWSVSECRNPSAVDFVGTVYYTPRVIEQLIPVFVIGDVEPHAIGDNVYFWGSQWWKNNDMSGTVSNGVASFKGYATEAGLTCGGVWASKPGNSSNPPATISSRIAVIVTSKVLKQGNNISGDIKQIVVVDQDGGYGPNPGHAGEGIVRSVTCTR